MATVIAPAVAFGDRTVTARYFGTGNASRLIWNLAGMDSDRALLMPVIYRKDWQMPGHYRLYSTARTNLFQRSQEFDNAYWGKGGGPNSAVTPDTTTAPDGTTTADSVYDTAIAGQHYLRRNVTLTSGTVYTVSFYVKPGTLNSFALEIYGATTFRINVTNITSLTYTTTGAGVTGTFTSIGGGWYRATMTFTCDTTGGNDFNFYVKQYASYTGTGTDYLYIWGAQLETGSSATSYIPTTNASASVTDYAVDANGKVTFAAAPVANADVAYLDPWFGTANYKSFGTGDGTNTQFSLPWKPVTEQIYKSDWAGNQLMYSSSRTNLALQSQTFQTTWTRNAILAFGAGSTVDAAVAPDGTTTADLIVEDNTTAQHYLAQTFVKAAASTQYTLSFYAKAKERSWIYLQGVDGGNFARCYYNIGTGAVGTSSTGGAGFTVNSTSISSVGNGWYRCVLTFTTTATTNLVCYVVMTTGNGTASYAGDNTSGLYVWGAQLETSASATPYIVTTTAAASATDYTITPGGTVTFATAPVSGAVLTWTGNFGAQR